MTTPIYIHMAKAAGLSPEATKHWIHWYLRGWKRRGPERYPRGSSPGNAEVCSRRMDEWYKLYAVPRKV